MNNIYLVGFMGTGKTETARLLAGQLKRVFVDMDELIEEHEKMPIADIFGTRGEAYFRKVEKQVIEVLSRKDNLVVACGGGAFVDPENIANFKKSGTVVCLTSLPETILRRTKQNRRRPLLNVPDPKARIEELLAQRQSSYARAHFTVDADKLTVGETAREVLKLLELK